MTNCHRAAGRLLVEDLIASTFKFFLKVLIGLEGFFFFFSQTLISVISAKTTTCLLRLCFRYGLNKLDTCVNW